MEETDKKEKFIELRALGKTYEEISKELGESTERLMQWTLETLEGLKKKDCGC